jgi:PAS domain S-box-containing protein
MEEIYRSFFETSLEAFARITVGGSFVIANSAMAQLLGFHSVNELILSTKDVSLPIYPNPEAKEHLLKRVETENEIRDFHQEIIRKDGSRTWVSANVRAVRESNGTLSHLDFSLLDITKQREFERGLLDRETLFRQVADASPISMVVSEGPKEKLCYLNRKFVDTFGYTESDVPDVEHWWPLAYPVESYRKRVIEEWQTKAEKAIATRGEIEPLKAVVTCKDGSVRCIDFRMTSIGPRHVIFLLDITERRHAEESAELLQTLAIGIGASSDFNSALESVVRTTYLRKGWAIGMPWTVSSDGTKLIRGPIYSQNAPGHRLEQRKELAQGIETPGLAWKSREPVFQSGAIAGLHTALAIPFSSEGKVVAVIEFFLQETRGEETFKISTLIEISPQIGGLLETRRASEALSAAVQQTARLAMAASDLANTPIQTLLLTAGMIRRGTILSPTTAEAMEISLNRLIRLGTLFRQYLSKIKWTGEQVGFDAWDTIRDEIDRKR